MCEGLEKAKAKLHSGGFTCVIEGEWGSFTSQEHGIKPIMDWLRNGAKGGVCADKVIGKAAAMLLVYGGVSEIYADVISSHALEFLETAGVAAAYDKNAEYIINRKGDGMCPMEERALELITAGDAFSLFSEIVK